MAWRNNVAVRAENRTSGAGVSLSENDYGRSSGGPTQKQGANVIPMWGARAEVRSEEREEMRGEMIEEMRGRERIEKIGEKRREEKRRVRIGLK